MAKKIGQIANALELDMYYYVWLDREREGG